MGPRLSPPVPVVHRGSSFAYSFSFLPREQREALRAIYAFCRQTDDLVDEAGERAAKIDRLRQWREEFTRSLSEEADSAVLRAFARTITRYEISVAHVYELLDGVEMDLTRTRYASFEELRSYCYHVASSVGLMCLPVFAPRHPGTKEYAVALGIALQLTNIIRDVGTDARIGRIYLPGDELQRFGCAEEDILALRSTPAFVGLMEFQAQRARAYFRQAQAALPAEDRRAMFAATIMERIYARTLERIAQSRFDVLARPICLPRRTQFLIAAKYYLQRRILSA